MLYRPHSWELYLGALLKTKPANRNWESGRVGGASGRNRRSCRFKRAEAPPETLSRFEF